MCYMIWIQPKIRNVQRVACTRTNKNRMHKLKSLINEESYWLQTHHNWSYCVVLYFSVFLILDSYQSVQLSLWIVSYEMIVT